MLETENTFPINDIGDDYAQGKSKGSFWTKPKKLILVLICAIIALVIYSIIISSYLKNEDNEKTEEENPEPEPEKKVKFGNIYSLYELEEDNIETNILYEKFQIPNNFTVYVDDNEINYTSKYRLSGKKKHNITYVLYEDFDMKQMFKNVQYLKK